MSGDNVLRFKLGSEHFGNRHQSWQYRSLPARVKMSFHLVYQNDHASLRFAPREFCSNHMLSPSPKDKVGQCNNPTNARRFINNRSHTIWMSDGWNISWIVRNPYRFTWLQFTEVRRR